MSQSIIGFSQAHVTPTVIILLPLCSLSRYSPPSLWCPFEDLQLGCTVHKTGDPSDPQGKVSLPWRHSPIWLTVSFQRYSQAVCMMCYLSVPWRSACLPGDGFPGIAMGLEQQGEKTQKPKGSKKGHSKCRASSMHSLCTLFCRGFCLHQPGARSGLAPQTSPCRRCCCTLLLLLHPAAAATAASVPHQGLVVGCQCHL